MEKNLYSYKEKFPKEISSKFEIIQEIGKGAFSTIYKVKSKENNNIYCLKQINTKKTKDKENEIKILSNLNHPNLIKYFFSFYNSENIYIIMEFCEYGDLFSLLQSVKKKKVFVNEEIIWNIAIQALLGLEYLHSKKIIHRDIKLLNLFMTKDKKIKIGDMGMSKIVEEGELIMGRVGTPLYLAPELIKKEKYDYKIDIWSLGCSLYHLAKTSPPFTDENLMKLGNSIINEQPPNLPVCYSNELYDFILRLMIKNKDNRPSAKEALELIPEKIRNNFYKKYNMNNFKKKKYNKFENNKLIEQQSQINNNSSSIINANNDNEITIEDKFISKSIKNENKFDKALISGQTFYQFFKINNNKNKSPVNRIEINNNDIINNNNNSNLLSKTTMHMNDNYKFNKFKFIENLKNQKSQEIKKNISISKLLKEREELNNKKKLSKENISINNELSNKKKITNHNLFKLLDNQHKNISMSLDKNEIFEKCKTNKDINNYYTKNIHDPVKTFMTKDITSKKNTIIINKSKLINKKFFIDLNNNNNENKKEETIFPKIENRYKFKSSSLGRYKYPDIQNFGQTGYYNNFKNKLTIHDLK